MERREESDPARPHGPGSLDRGAEAAPPRRRTAVAPELGTIDLLLRAGDYGQAWEDCRRLLREPDFSDHPGLVRRTAYSLDKLGRFEDVRALLEPFLAEAPVPDELGEREELARCRLILGKVLHELGRLAEAEAQGHLALSTLRDDATGPEAGFVHNLLGTIRFRQGEADEARTHFRAALDHFRSRGDVTNLALAYINLGHVHKSRCEWDRAVEHYNAAYYLRATEGEFQDQGAILQNLALVQLKLGRYEEAQGHLETSLRQARNLGSRARVLRSHLALALLGREMWDLKLMRQHLEAAQTESGSPPPGRDGCLLVMEAAYLARFEGRVDDAERQAEDLRARVESLAARGDLMVESLLLDGSLALDRGDAPTAEHSYRRARELAHADLDRFEETKALLGLAEVAIRARHTEEAERTCQMLAERLVSGGEQPMLARVHLLRGRIALELRADPEEALGWFRRARDLWRRLVLPRQETLADLRMAASLLALGRAGEAAALAQAARERLAGGVDVPFGTAAELAALEETLRERLAHPPSPGIDGGRAFARMEELVSSDAGVGEKLRGVLLLIIEALSAEGGFVARSLESGLEVVSSASMGRLQGRRTWSRSALGLGEVVEPTVVKHPPTSGAGASSEDSSAPALVWPITFFGRPHLVWVERREAGRVGWGRAELDYGMVLLAEASRGLRPLVPLGGVDDGGLEGSVHLADVITQNHRMHSILELIRRVADSDLTVLLQGETGTGKKLLAEVLHRASDRRDRAFVTVDCAALTDSLLESELFGHRKGAFTGATSDRVGLLEEGNGGTVFLDEIDKSGLSVQRRLLHMLDSGEVRPVGATGYKRLDVRVVCATSCPDLRQEVAEGRFLKDLFYRLNDISIVVPPLRERPDDVALLAEWFVERFAARLGRKIAGVTPAFHAALASHAWPGNVRELEKAIRRAITLADDGGFLVPDLLPSAVLESSGSGDGAVGGSLHDRLERYERGLLIEALDRHAWNKSRAAVELGLSRRGLKNKIERYRLDRRRSRRR